MCLLKYEVRYWLTTVFQQYLLPPIWTEIWLGGAVEVLYTSLRCKASSLLHEYDSK